MHVIKRLALLVCALAVLAVPATAGATISTKTIDYGPYTIPAGNGDPHDHENAGVTPDLVYTDDDRVLRLDRG